MKITANETVLTGRWLIHEGHIVGDETCERIEQMIHSHLKLLGRDSSGWETLYRDPEDGRFWELSYPQGHLQGGGPPQLRCLTVDDVRKKYRGLKYGG